MALHADTAFFILMSVTTTVLAGFDADISLLSFRTAVDSGLYSSLNLVLGFPYP